MTNRASLFLAGYVCLSAAGTSAAEGPVIYEGQIGCGNWMAGRAIDYAGPLAQLVLGYFDGLSHARNIGFWKAGDPTESRNAVYKWLDNYCGQHDASTVLDGADLLFKERTGLVPSGLV